MLRTMDTSNNGRIYIHIVTKQEHMEQKINNPQKLRRLKTEPILTTIRVIITSTDRLTENNTIEQALPRSLKAIYPNAVTQPKQFIEWNVKPESNIPITRQNKSKVQRTRIKAQLDIRKQNG